MAEREFVGQLKMEGEMNMRYTVVLTRDEDGGFDAAVPALVGCRTWGQTKREAWANAREAIAAYVGSLRKEGDPVPEEAGMTVVQVR